VADPEWIRDYCTVMADFQIMHLAALFDEAGRPDGMRVCEDLGYIFSTDHSVSTNVAYADYQYYADVFRDNMTY